MANDNLNIKVILDNSQIDTSIAGLKKSFRELSTLAGSSILSNEDKTKVLVRMGEIQNKIQDTRKTIRSLDDDNVFENMAQVVGPLTASFTAAGSALSLFGVENEKVNEILVKTTQLTVALSSLQQVADARKLKNMLVARAEQLKSFLVDKLTFNITKEKAAANIAEAGTKGVATVATKLATKAQLAWNAAVNENSIMILVAAVATLVIGIIALSKAFNNSTDEAKDYEKTIDGIIIKDEKLRESHNESIKTLKELEIEQKVLTGVISEEQGKIEKIYLDWQYDLYKLDQENKKVLDEIAKDTVSLWDLLNYGFSAYALKREATLQKQKEANDNFRDQVSLRDQQYFATLGNASLKSAKDIENREKELNKKINDFQISRLKKTISTLSSEYDAARSAAEKIVGIYDTLTSKIEDINIEMMPEGIEKELAKIDLSLKRQITDYKGQNTELTRQKNTLQQSLDIITQSEILLRSQKSAVGLIGSLTNQEASNLLFVNETLKNTNDELNKSNTIYQSTISKNEEIILSTEERNKQLKKGSDLYKENIKIIKELRDKNQEYFGIVSKNSEEVQQNWIKIIKNENEIKQLGVQQALNDQEKVEVQKTLKDLEKKRVDLNSQLVILGEKEKDNADVVSDAELKSFEQTQKQKQLVYENFIKGIKKSAVEESIDIQNAELQILKLKEGEYEKIIQDEKASVESKLDDWNKIKDVYNKEITIEKELSELRKQQIQLSIDEQNVIKEKLNDTIKYYEELGPLTEEQDMILKASLKQRELIEKQLTSLFSKLDLEDEKVKQAINEIVKIIESQPPEVTIKPKVTIKWGKHEMDEEEFKKNYYDTVGQLMEGVGQVIGDNIRQSLENEMTRLDKYYDTEQSSLEKLRDAELITEQEYNDRLSALDEEKAKKEKELKIRQFKAEQQAALINIAMDAAVGIMKAWATDVITAPFLTAFILAQAGIQSSLVAAQPMPEYEVGGKINGPLHKAGGVPLVAEGGEYIVKKEIVKRPGVEQFLNKLNFGSIKIPELATGGLVRTMTNTSTNNIYNYNNTSSSVNNALDEDTIRRIVREVVAIPVVNVETDYTRVQRKVKSIETRRLF